MVISLNHFDHGSLLVQLYSRVKLNHIFHKNFLFHCLHNFTLAILDDVLPVGFTDEVALHVCIGVKDVARSLIESTTVGSDHTASVIFYTKPSGLVDIIADIDCAMHDEYHLVELCQLINYRGSLLFKSGLQIPEYCHHELSVIWAFPI